jgi:alanine racemase
MKLRERVPNGAKTCCVIKADAYGHGASAVAKRLEKAGADFFAVSNIDEALELSYNHISLPILILGYTPPMRAKELSVNNISQCVYSSEYADLLEQSAREGGFKISVHIKIDSGMGRLGFVFRHDEEFFEELIDVCSRDCFVLEGIFTHFSSADEGEEGDEYTAEQLNHFNTVVRELRARGVKFELRHASASSAILDHPEAELDMVRAGIVLYGISPSDSIRKSTDGLMPAMKLKTVVLQVKELLPGEFVSYGRTYQAEEKRTVATLPIGYADGFLRRNSKIGTELEVSGRRAKLIGRVCMDQCVIDISGIDGVRVGDEVTVFGGDITVEELARLNRTIPYEIFCGISRRIPRIYISGGKVSHIADYILDI